MMDDESWRTLFRSWALFTLVSSLSCVAFGLIIGWAIWGA